MCGAARCGELNSIFLASLEAALTADAAWDGHACRFSRRPERGLRAFSSIYAGWGVGASYYLDRDYAAAGFASAQDFLQRSYIPAFAGCDADDLLAQAPKPSLSVCVRHAGREGRMGGGRQKRSQEGRG